MAHHTRKFKIGFQGPLDIELEQYLAVQDLDIKGLFHYVARGMHFSYETVLEDGISEQLPNGSWTGLVGLLNKSDIDFAPAEFIETEERWDAVAFNYPYFIDEIVFATRKPRYSPETMALFRTLSSPVWLSLLVSTILVTLVCFITLKYRCTVQDIIFHVLAIGLNQHGNIIPQKALEVLLLCTWMVAMALFTSCFKSVLLSFLSFPPLTSVRTVPELAAAIRAGKYSTMAVEDKYLTRYLQGSPMEDIRLIGDNTLKIPAGYIEDLFNLSAKNPHVAFVYPKTYLSFAEDKLYVSKDNMGTYLRATAVSKDFCCKDEVDMIVHRFLAAGISQKIYRYEDFRLAFELFSEMPVDNDDETRKITMTDISEAFILLVAGHCLSVCTLIVELGVKNIRKKTTKDKKKQKKLRDRKSKNQQEKNKMRVLKQREIRVFVCSEYFQGGVAKAHNTTIVAEAHMDYI